MKNRLFAAFVLAAVSALVADADCVDGVQASGALYRICMPETGWNGSLIIYDHGYTSPAEDLALPGEFEDQPFSPSIDRIFTSLGYAFAGSSYSTSGLAVQEGMADTLDLLEIFTEQFGAPDHVYLLGISMGGLVAALLGEQYPDQIDGVLCGCAPVGSFQEQINWLGDFRVVFDFFFPWLLPGTPTEIPRVVQELWPLYYSFVIRPALADPLNAEKLHQFQAITQAPVDPENPGESWERTLQILLWYNVFSTNDAAGKLGGQPYDNTSRQYGGIPSEFWFNGLVRRYGADPAAAEAIASAYETSGDIQIPMILLHTTLDPVVPYAQVARYEEKAAAQGRATLVTHIATEGYGHCLFGLPEVVTGLALAVKEAEGDGAGQAVVSTALDDGAWGAADREAFRDLAKSWGFAVPQAPVAAGWLDWLIALIERILQTLAQ